MTKIESIYLPHGDDLHVTGMHLTEPVCLGTQLLSAHALCSICAVRLPLSATERLILCLVLSDRACGITRTYSYTSLGCIIGKGAHSAKRAVATLRKNGLLLSSRVGRSAATLAFSCDAFVRWADTVLSEHNLAAMPVTPVSVRENPIDAQDDVVSTFVSASDAKRRPATPSDHTERKTTRRKRQTPAEAVPCASSETVSLVAKEKGTPSADKLPAGCRVDDHGFVVYDESSGIPPPPEFQMAAPYEGEFDAAIERADTLAAAGRTETSASDDDEDDISFGSETAETDMGQGVRMNPNI